MELFATAVRHALQKNGFFDALFDKDKAPIAFATIVGGNSSVCYHKYN